MEDRTAPAGADFGFAFGYGDSGDDQGNGIVADAAGNFYVSGSFNGTVDFDPGPDTESRTGHGAFIAKYSSTRDLTWVRVLQISSSGGFGAPFCAGSDITIDSSGNSYVIGCYPEGTFDLDPGPGTFQVTGPGSYVLKFNSAGDFVWATEIDGRDEITLDSAGNVYVVGVSPLAGDPNAVITKLNSAGAVTFQRVFATGGTSGATGVAVDQAGNIYVGGNFTGTVDFDPTPATVSRTAQGDSDIFVAKFTSGGSLVWVETFGSVFVDATADLSIDGDENLVFTGGTGSEDPTPYTVDFDPGPGQAIVQGPGGFAVKLNKDGGVLWARGLADGGSSIVFDRGDNIYLGTDRNTIIKLRPDGGLIWTVRVSSATSSLKDIALGDLNSIFITGFYKRPGGLDFDPGPGTYNLPDPGPCCPDVFVVKLIQRHDTTLTGTDTGTPAEVRQYDAETGSLLFSFFPYGESFTGGVRVATGDVNGDGFTDIITVPGPGFGPLVKVFNGLTKKLLPYPLGQFYAYSASNTAPGFHIAVGDVNMDGRADIITAPGPGMGGLVRVFSGRDRALLHQFNVYSGSTGGVHVAAGDVNGDGRADIITAPASQRGPLVYVFNGINRAVIRSFAAYESSFTGGVWVATGHFDNDGRADILTGPGQGRGPLVRVWNGSDGSLRRSFNAYESTFTGGVRVATTDADNDDLADIIVAPGRDREPFVRIFDGQESRAIDQFFAADLDYTGGLFVAGGRGR